MDSKDTKRQRYESYIARAKVNDWPEMVEHWQTLLDALENENADSNRDTKA